MSTHGAGAPRRVAEKGRTGSAAATKTFADRHAEARSELEAARHAEVMARGALSTNRQALRDTEKVIRGNANHSHFKLGHYDKSVGYTVTRAGMKRRYYEAEARRVELLNQGDELQQRHAETEQRVRVAEQRLAELEGRDPARLTSTGSRPSGRAATGTIPYAGAVRVAMSAPTVAAGIKQAYTNASKARDALASDLGLRSSDIVPYFVRIRVDAAAASDRSADEFTHESGLRKQIATALGVYHSTEQDVSRQQQIVDAAKRAGQQNQDGYSAIIQRAALAETRRDLAAYNLTRLISQAKSSAGGTRAPRQRAAHTDYMAGAARANAAMAEKEGKPEVATRFRASAARHEAVGRVDAEITRTRSHPTDAWTGKALTSERARYARGDLSAPAPRTPGARESSATRENRVRSDHAAYSVWLRYGPGAALTGKGRQDAEAHLRQLSRASNAISTMPTPRGRTPTRAVNSEDTFTRGTLENRRPRGEAGGTFRLNRPPRTAAERAQVGLAQERSLISNRWQALLHEDLPAARRAISAASSPGARTKAESALATLQREQKRLSNRLDAIDRIENTA